MHLNAKRPIFVPPEYCDEIEKLSKAALMDLCWDLAMPGQPNDGATMEELRKRIEVVVFYRRRGTE